MSVWGPILAALLGGGLVQIIVSVASRKKTDAEATDIISQAAERLVQRLEVEITSLRRQITDQTAQITQQSVQIASLRREIDILRSEIRRLGGDPDDVLTVRNLHDDPRG